MGSKLRGTNIQCGYIILGFSELLGSWSVGLRWWPDGACCCILRTTGEVARGERVVKYLCTRDEKSSCGSPYSDVTPYHPIHDKTRNAILRHANISYSH